MKGRERGGKRKGREKKSRGRQLCLRFGLDPHFDICTVNSNDRPITDNMLGKRHLNLIFVGRIIVSIFALF